MKQLLVKDWMTTDPITVDPETTLPIAYHLMKLNNIRRLPIVLEDGTLVGIVTMSDIRQVGPKQRSDLDLWDLDYVTASLEVRDFMTPQPFAVTPDTPIQAAAALMLEHKIGGLPVVEQGQVVGIITESDIFRAMAEQYPNPDLAIS